MMRSLISLLLPLVVVANETSKCVTINYYNDIDCETKVRRQSKFSTYAKPGESPCLTDTTGHMKGISIADMFCMEDSYYMSVYRHSEICEGEFDADLFLAKICHKGAMFVSCDDGPCPAEEDEGTPSIVTDLYVSSQS